jgi:hypothetical protein
LHEKQNKAPFPDEVDLLCIGVKLDELRAINNAISYDQINECDEVRDCVRSKNCSFVVAPWVANVGRLVSIEFRVFKQVIVGRVRLEIVKSVVVAGFNDRAEAGKVTLLRDSTTCTLVKIEQIRLNDVLIVSEIVF